MSKLYPGSVNLIFLDDTFKILYQDFKFINVNINLFNQK